jgi:hypothetical protein
VSLRKRMDDSSRAKILEKYKIVCRNCDGEDVFLHYQPASACDSGPGVVISLRCPDCEDEGVCVFPY